MMIGRLSVFLPNLFCCPCPAAVELSVHKNSIYTTHIHIHTYILERKNIVKRSDRNVKMKTFFLSLLLCSMVFACTNAFNYTVCPSAEEIQSEKVKSNFDMEKFFGTYYELAYHDYTQYPTCPLGPTCIRSVKRKEPIAAAPGYQVVDWFSLNCAGKGYPFPLRFNTTNTTGLLQGYVKDPPIWWKLLEPGDVYSDVVVDYLEVDGKYEWVIEFQCKYNKRGSAISFIGINFYSRSRNVSKDYMDNFLQAARDRGLGMYMDKGFGTKTVDQGPDCKYPDIPPATLGGEGFAHDGQ